MRSRSGIGNWTFRSSILAVLGLVAMAALMPVFLLHAANTSAELEKRTRERMIADVAKTVQRLDAHIRDLLAWASHVGEDLPYPRAALGDRSGQWAGITPSMDEEGLEALRRRHGFQAIAVLAPGGQPVFQAGDLLRPDLLGSWSYFQDALRGRAAVSDLFTDHTGARAFVAAVAPVRTGPGGRILGVVAIVEPVERLNAITDSDTGAIASGSFGVLSGEYTVRFRHGANSKLDGYPISPLPVDVLETQLRERRQGALTEKRLRSATHDRRPVERNAVLHDLPHRPVLNRGYVAAARSDGLICGLKLDAAPWVYWVAVPTAAYLDPVWRQLEIDVAILLAVLGAVGFLAAALSRRLARPIVALRQAAVEWEGGNLAARAPDPGRNEIGELAMVFNRMADRLQRNTEHLEDKVEDRTAQLTEVNAQLREAYERLKEADHYKDEFLGVISHELRTPLNFITGFSSILDDRVAGPITPEQSRHLQQILKGADRMLQLVEELLDISRMAAGKFELAPEAAEVPPVVEEAILALRPLADKKRISVSSDLGDGGQAIFDRLRLLQVLLNLIGNAIKFTPEGGRVEVRALERDGDLLVEVTDTGPGIAQIDQPRLFQRFGQLDMRATRKVGGAGLGLSISKAIVTAHGGDIGVTSQAGAGSTFWFTVPLVGPRSGISRGAGDGRS